MTHTEFTQIERHMLTLMSDSAHDCQHIYRVLYAAADIAGHEKINDMDVLIAACLLHDIGRDAQFENPSLCHAEVGSAMAYEYLLSIGWEERRAAHVRDCVGTHRFRGDNPPVSIEAKILFDADKLDVTGAIGIARTLLYAGETDVPLYEVDEHGDFVDGTQGGADTFVREYNHKLRNIYGVFHTERARGLALSRRDAAVRFYESLIAEATDTPRLGRETLRRYLEPQL